jgi:hypothetical protein
MLGHQRHISRAEQSCIHDDSPATTPSTLRKDLAEISTLIHTIEKSDERETSGSDERALSNRTGHPKRDPHLFS